MADFPQTINYDQLTTKTQALVADLTAIEDAEMTLATLGDIPDKLQYVTDEAEYNANIAERATWQNDFNAANTTIATSGTQSEDKKNDLISIIPANTWLKMDTTPDDSPTYYWIGYNTDDTPGYKPKLRVVEGGTEPTPPLTHNMTDPIGIPA